jgi:2-amino-4-hydroxy-6-hydroxymethyldihydropteridine diphosphokinase
LVKQAMARLDRKGIRLVAASPIVRSRPLGPSLRDYANAVALVRTRLPPEALLARLHAIEAKLGRRRARRWGSRTMDLDIVLWEGGRHASPTLTIPHPALATRAFVLRPLTSVAPRWPVPPMGRTPRHLSARLTRPKRSS